MSTDKRYRFSQIFSEVRGYMRCMLNYIKKKFFGIKLGLIFLFIFFIETNFPREIILFSPSFDLFFTFIFFLSLYIERNLFLIGICLGLLKDILNISRFPLNTLIFAFWSYFLKIIFKRFYKENTLLEIFFLIFCIWLNSAIFFLFRREINFLKFLIITSSESLYGVIFYFFLFRFLKPCIQS